MAINGALGEVLHIDVDRHSTARFSIAARINVDPTPYSTGAGPLGVDVTPDAATILTSVAEDAAHPTPVALTIDRKTDQVVGPAPGREPVRHRGGPAALS